MSRATVSNALKMGRSDSWRGKALTSQELLILRQMVSAHEYSRTVDGISCFLLNNKKGECAFLVVTDEEIRCWFGDELPKGSRERISSERMDVLTEFECHVKEKLGRMIRVFNKEFFVPNSLGAFGSLASKRKMSRNEYSLFLLGAPFLPSRTNNDDAFLNELENVTKGSTWNGSIVSLPGLENYLARNKLSLDSFLEVIEKNECQVAKVASESESADKESDVKTQTSPILPDKIISLMRKETSVWENPWRSPSNTRSEKSVELDMKVRRSKGDYVGSVFARSPLLGRELISQENLRTIRHNSRTSLERIIREYDGASKESLTMKMQVTLATVDYAKGWNDDSDSEFWSYISSQFGFHDESGKIRRAICKCIADSMRENHRWIVASGETQLYKSTILIHAYANKDNWDNFFAFLMEFYMQNLHWQYSREDPLIERMIQTLRKEIIIGADGGNSIEISAKRYRFGSEIKKLVVEKPVFATQMASDLLERIDANVKGDPPPARNYQDQLCDEWMERHRDRRIGKVRHERILANADRAVDSAKVKPLYRLANNKSVVISVPDIRLPLSKMSSAVLTVKDAGCEVLSRSLSYYGNEMGWTITGFSLELEDYLRKAHAESIRPNLSIMSGEELVYDSGETLYRDHLLFKGDSETSSDSYSTGLYSVFAPQSTEIQYENTEGISIVDTPFLKGEMFFLDRDTTVRVGQSIIAPTNSAGRGARVILPEAEGGVTYVVRGESLRVSKGREPVQLMLPKGENTNDYQVLLNGKAQSIADLPVRETERTRIYQLDLQGTTEHDIDLVVKDSLRSKVLSSVKYKILPAFFYRFSRQCYLTENDYINAELLTTIGDQPAIRCSFGRGESSVSVPFEAGELVFPLPLASVRDNYQNRWFDGKKIWKGDVGQGFFLYPSLPKGLSAEVTLDGTKVARNKDGGFELGNAVVGYAYSEGKKWLSVDLQVTKDGAMVQQYPIGKIAIKEQFVQQPIFTLKGTTLCWDKGYGYYGSDDEPLEVTICEGTDEERTIQLDNARDVVAVDIKLATGIYPYQIRKQPKNIFFVQKEEITTGEFVVGDINEARFVNQIIKVQTLSFENNEFSRIVRVLPCFIDGIEYQGIEHIPAEGRDCPVYTGTLYEVDENGNRREYSSEDGTDADDVLRYKVNPVKMVYINDDTIGITNEDDAGLYFIRRDIEHTRKAIYQITDREPMESERDAFNVADLFGYKKERC